MWFSWQQNITAHVKHLLLRYEFRRTINYRYIYTQMFLESINIGPFQEILKIWTMQFLCETNSMKPKNCATPLKKDILQTQPLYDLLVPHNSPSVIQGPGKISSILHQQEEQKKFYSLHQVLWYPGNITRTYQCTCTYLNQSLAGQNVQVYRTRVISRIAPSPNIWNK